MILRLTSSGKAIQLIDDEGNVFQLGLHQLKRYVEDGNAIRFLVLTEMPYKSIPGKFPKSPMYEGTTSLDLTKLSTPGFDALSSSHKHKQAVERVAEDAAVDWD